MVQKLSTQPPRPGDVLQQHFSAYEALNQADLAAALSMSRLTANELLNGHRAINPLMALKLARLFETDAEYWLNLQTAWDLYHTRIEHEAEIATLPTLRTHVPVATHGHDAAHAVTA
jgi:antitoxin HigA-1